jgi:hypothetical protein
MRQTKRRSGRQQIFHMNSNYRTLPVTILFSILFHIKVNGQQSYYNTNNINNYVLRWTLSGGGWRSMFTNIGFINAFKQAGIVDVDSRKTKITGISSTSGATWSIGPLAYSQEYFNKAVPDDPSDTYQFTMDWMDAYYKFTIDYQAKYKYSYTNVTANTTNTTNTVSSNRNDILLAACRAIPFDFISSIEDISAVCSLSVRSDFAWGEFLKEMFTYVVSTKNYTDPKFLDLAANSENIIPLFHNTDLMFQTAVMPTSKVVNKKKQNKRWWQKILARLSPFHSYDTKHQVTYGGPRNNRSIVFTIPIPTQYAVTRNLSSFRYALEEYMLPMQIYTGPAPKKFSFYDYDQYYYFNKDDTDPTATIKGSTLTFLPNDQAVRDSVQTFEEPFLNKAGGGCSLLQIMSASSAILSDSTGAVPSYLAQRFSYRKWEIEVSNTPNYQKRVDLAKLERKIDLIYSSNYINEAAVCSSWRPRKNKNDNNRQLCSTGDTRIIDGYVADGPGTLMNKNVIFDHIFLQTTPKKEKVVH